MVELMIILNIRKYYNQIFQFFSNINAHVSNFQKKKNKCCNKFSGLHNLNVDAPYTYSCHGSTTLVSCFH